MPFHWLEDSSPIHNSVIREEPMKHVYRNVVVASLFLILALASRGPVAGQGLTSSEEAVIKASAQRHVERYYNFYYEQNPEALSTEIFTVPWITMGGNGVTIHAQEENLEYFSSAIAGLIGRGWDKSTFRTKNVCVFGAGSAIVSGTNTRTRPDGSIMSVGGVSYILGTIDDGWRVISFAGHSPDKVVRCDVE
jgi:hypothetical protein